MPASAGSRRTRNPKRSVPPRRPRRSRAARERLELEGKRIMSNVSQEQVIEFLSNLSVIDLVNLTKSLEDKWGVKAAPVAVAAAGGGGGAAAAAAPAEEKTEFTVVLKAGGANKINVIKVVR